jgi:hypothetical protein
LGFLLLDGHHEGSCTLKKREGRICLVSGVNAFSPKANKEPVALDSFEIP